MSTLLPHINSWVSDWGEFRLPSDFPTALLTVSGWLDRRSGLCKQARSYIKEQELKLQHGTEQSGFQAPLFGPWLRGTRDMRCKQDMLDAGEALVPRTCPVHGLNHCRPFSGTAINAVYQNSQPPARKGDWMQTYTGAQFWPLDPRADEVRFEDIAAALSKLCRYGGQTIRFYSVAEHCVHVASKAPDWLKRDALLHDASEAYLCDIIRPIKSHLANYLEIEARLEGVIAERFGLFWPMNPEIKRLDTAILADERDQVMAPPPAPWPQIPGIDPLGVTLRFWTPAQAQYEFTTAFYRYGGK